MEYIAAFLSFIVALIGIHGNTWNAKAKGWKRLTKTGWIIAVCALLTLSLGSTAAWMKNDENRIAREQRKMVNRIAEMEICLASAHLKAAFDVLAAIATGKTTQDGADLGFQFTLLENEKTIDAIENIDLLARPLSRPRIGDMRPLDEFITAQSNKFVAQTNMALTKYSTFLDKDIILKSTWLVNQNLVQRMLVTSEQVTQVKKAGGKKYPGLWPYERTEEYLEALKLLKAVSKMSGGDETGLTCKRPAFFRGVNS
ncbi:MAG: hypothetical protein DID91_2727703450 [Candidatus Nitrotoga sp. MKT]|nr:MAG: hypothetical protein DID91_2727703450 [Candidatus Nitrotoga sp. MKT]